MTTAIIATKCPEWCESIHKEEEDPADVAHYGPQWQSLPIGDYPFSVQIIAFADEKGQIKVNVETPSIDLTPEQALEAGRYLIEAGQWALAHKVA